MDFTIYNVHLTNGVASTRYSELEKIQKDIASLTAGNSVVMIAGDFNIGGGKETASGPQTNAFDDTEKTMKILYVYIHGPRFVGLLLDRSNFIGRTCSFLTPDRRRIAKSSTWTPIIRH